MVLTVACGGSTTHGAGGTGGTGGSGGASGSGGSGGVSPVGCPSSPPTGGASCTHSNLQCTYGDSVRPDCRDSYLCANGAWEVSGTACVSPPASVCGTSTPKDGGTCSQDGAVCTYGQTICVCNACSFGPCRAGPPTWTCGVPPTTTGCPPVVPNNGSACSSPGVTCTYGVPCSSSGAVVTCTGGAWQWQPIACSA